ncbi:fatty acid desaturase 6 [Sphaerodactylus townsendi]|uniref:fatty acid desaturase 6 n=1 Tax=Sphaerodactylus townsendi TaxID=933632 RepID=UPI00202724AE|nr:fatty acid desaturase 6 [Sphaerodactylus townsendi]
MEPRQQEMLMTNQEWRPERREQKQFVGEGAPSGENSFQEGGETLGREGAPTQGTANAILQLQSSFKREGTPENEGLKEQGLRPSQDYSGLGKEGRSSSPAEEMVILKRAVKEEDMLPAGERRCEDSLMRELSEMVQKVVKKSSWWEKHGIDVTIIALNFLFLPVGFLLLRSDSIFSFLMGIVVLGVAHFTITVKGSHLASHSSLVESKSWGKVLAIFFEEVCSAFTAEQGTYNHVKLHHGYTNVIGLGDSSTWKIPFLNRYVYMFIAPIAIPIITPLVAIGLLKEVRLKTAIRTLCCMFLGLYSHYWLLINISEFRSTWSALGCMLLTRSLLAHSYIHVNIFQHIGLPMFAPNKLPKRIHMMSSGVLNLPRNALLDWSFGHSLISCHTEHHLFPTLSDNMCLKIKPLVSQYLKEKKLPYNEDSYLARLKLFLNKYEELMVHVPPITELVGIQ